MRCIFILICCFVFSCAFSANIFGVVKDSKGNVLPYASISVAPINKNTTANSKGEFSIVVANGTYTVSCLHVGYATKQQVVVVNGNVEINFILEEQAYKMNEVVVNSKGEDPAYAIIRKTIEKRAEYEKELSTLECKVYLKGQLQLRNYPKKFFGQTVDFEDGDTSKRKMIFLSETIANYAVNGEDRKIDVVSTRVSGSSNSFGFSDPRIVNLYKNVLQIGSNLNPRGFISPISNNAFNFYKYKFMGTFFENGVEINRIKVIPKRTYEPLFSGYINIIENSWRLQGVQLQLVKEQQMQFLDTLNIEQLFVQNPQKQWVLQQQVIEPSGKVFGFDFFGAFVEVYSNINLQPNFTKKSFGSTLLKFTDSSNKRSLAYWDSIRPLPLLASEIKDYKKKDSLEQAKKDPKYVDSLDRVRNKITFGKVFLFGQSFGSERKKTDLSFSPLFGMLNSFNSVEGYVINFKANYAKRFEGRRRFDIGSNIRYGFSNKLLNANISAEYRYGKKYLNVVEVSGGSNVFQFNNANPISGFANTLATLINSRNYMKLYQAGFANISWYKGLGNGIDFQLIANYQDRRPLENTSDFTLYKKNDRPFTPNYPFEITNTNLQPHQAFSITAGIVIRPGTKYVEYPDRKVNIGSKYPVMVASITKGIDGFLGSDVDYLRWNFRASDNLNMKIGGRLSYRLETGGFITANKVQIPDFTHFIGNQTLFATPYLRSFQLLPYYAYSNTASLFATGHVEYHLNGLLTNKIPVIKKLNWFLVGGASVLTVQGKNNYAEVLVGLENIFKIMRVDYVQGIGLNNPSGIRISLPFIN
jgi:hypothetical protein